MSAMEEASLDAVVVPRAAARIRRAQRWHAGLVLVAPALGCVLAAREVVLGHLRPWHLALLAVGYAVTMLGITVGFHRLLTHRAFKTSSVVRAGLAVAGSMAVQGPALYWVCNHRLHHQRSDKAGDPHSPHVRDTETLTGLRGLWHAHAGWAFEHELANPVALAKDLLKDARLRWVNQRYLLWVFLGLALPTLFGALTTGSARGAYEGFVWGGLVRVFLNFHVTCSINSLTHRFGYRTYTTKDQSRNNAWLALPTLGEAWHNNHHAFPNSAWLGLTPWEVDLGAWFIRALMLLGLAQEPVRPSAAARDGLRIAGRDKP